MSRHFAHAARSGLHRRSLLGAIGAASVLALTAATPALSADNASGPGYSETEIRLGNSVPYSGHGSTYGQIGAAIKAYFDYVNDQGGVNGRKVRFLSYDDGFSAPKTVENVRRLVEQDDVLAIAGIVGTPTNASVQPYLNRKKVPQLFTATGSSKFSRPKEFPWTIGWMPTFRTEGLVYGDYVRANHPDAKIAILFQHDDYGKEVLEGVIDALGPSAANVVEKISYEATQPTLDSEILKAKASGADVFVNISMGRAASQSIRKVREIGWNPVHIINYVGSSVGGVLVPAGVANAEGLISSAVLRDPTDPEQKGNPEVERWNAFLDKYQPNADRTNSSIVMGYALGQTLAHVLQRAGYDLSRENVMRQATSLNAFRPEMVMDGLSATTTPDDYFVFKKTRLMKFRDGRWHPLGGLRAGL